MRRFELHRDEDVSGVSGTGVVAEGAVFTDGTAVLRWTGGWPSSVVWHDRGVESVLHVHGHDGRTRLIWIDTDHHDRRPHSRACAWADHPHGPACHRTCPTCHPPTTTETDAHART